MYSSMFNLLYKTKIRPILEYGNIIWNPRYAKDAEAIENVQRRATKMVPNLKHYSYQERLQKLNLPTLSYRRKRGDMIETYKYLNELYNTDHKWLHMDNTSSTRGHSKKLNKLRCNTELRRHSFSNRVVNNWNSLPEHVISAPTLNSFKARLDKHWEQMKYTSE